MNSRVHLLADPGSPQVVPLLTDPLSEVENLWKSNAFPISSLPYHVPNGFGVIGYDAARYFEKLPTVQNLSPEPDIFFVIPDIMLILDREAKSLSLVSLFGTESVFQHYDSLLTSVEQSEHNANYFYPGSAIQIVEKYDRRTFARQVERAKEYLCAGDIFQVVLSNIFTLSTSVSPLLLYDVLRDRNPSPYHFLFTLNPSTTLVGASPEVFLQSAPAACGQQEIKMRLVAGTYPSAETMEADLGITQALPRDIKERAEHVMLVDHARNDLGRVSEIGSVRATELLSVESYRDVHHLVSEVRGILQKDHTVFSAIRAAFPIATLTGTPKIRAMEIISELEGPSRGVFGGSCFALYADGSIDSGVCIRTARVEHDKVVIRAGAGIVYDSNPEREYEECRWKAKTIVDALSHLTSQPANASNY